MSMFGQGQIKGEKTAEKTADILRKCAST